MSDNEREINDDAGLSDEANLVVHDAFQAQSADEPVLTVVATITARGEVRRTPELTTVGIETEHVRQIRYSSGDRDGVRYVEVVDGAGEHVASGIGEAADALTDLMLYLLPPDDSDYPDA
jgi:hypothetical protein